MRFKIYQSGFFGRDFISVSSILDLKKGWEGGSGTLVPTLKCLSHSTKLHSVTLKTISTPFLVCFLKKLLLRIWQ